MAKIDDIFTGIFNDIKIEGDLRSQSRMFWKDSTPAYFKSIFGKSFSISPEDGFPILTKKFVPVKSMSQEILWIWQKQSNNVQELRDMGCKVWDEWELPDGTIGKAYGYQLANNYYLVDPNQLSDKSIDVLSLPFENKEDMVEMSRGKKYPLNQVQYVIQQLIDNPYNRQILTTLWKIDDLNEMSLQPCVYETQWIVVNGKVDLIVRVRSSDTFLGLPYNVAQYSLLHRLISHVVGIPFGNITFQLGDVHLYDRHDECAEIFNQNPSFEAPNLWIDPSVKHFEDFEYNKNFGLVDYKLNVGNAGKIETEVCITIDELNRLSKKGE